MAVEVKAYTEEKNNKMLTADRVFPDLLASYFKPSPIWKFS